MSHLHAIVWIDHTKAIVMHVSPDDVEKSTIEPTHPSHKVHGHAGTLGSGRTPDDQDFLHRVVVSLQGAKEILIVGPAQAKLQLVKHIHAHDPALVDKVVGVESVDHPTDGQLVAYARKYFRAKDMML
jgi:stalled ribosome rescue protein Dom34